MKRILGTFPLTESDIHENAPSIRIQVLDTEEKLLDMNFQNLPSLYDEVILNTLGNLISEDTRRKIYNLLIIEHNDAPFSKTLQSDLYIHNLQKQYPTEEMNVQRKISSGGVLLDTFIEAEHPIISHLIWKKIIE